MARLAIALAVGVSMSAGAAHGAIVNSWETGVEGWSGITTTTGTGVTHGSSAALRDMPAGWSNTMQSGYSNDIRVALTGENLLKVDVTPEFAAPSWATFRITAQVIANGGVDQQLGAQSVIGGATQTLTWDYSSISSAIDAATSWGHVRFITEVYGGVDVGNVTFDNLRTGEDVMVPEPGALAAVALGALSLTRRRRPIA
ncbi:MAG TPA: PEP-CTERM sorting domain-containing protein [Tepidisphaeraceae bacterium]|jgi:hypothetical protein|nr:PEP-CTERM sorting domain-containing protein [Tepidisphaeraceae bacterium]